jgi:hypothetical protein
VAGLRQRPLDAHTSDAAGGAIDVAHLRQRVRRAMDAASAATSIADAHPHLEEIEAALKAGERQIEDALAAQYLNARTVRLGGEPLLSEEAVAAIGEEIEAADDWILNDSRAFGQVLHALDQRPSRPLV